MRLLLDSHLLIAITRDKLASDYPRLSRRIAARGHTLLASVASLWEIAIKVRLGKLDAGVELASIPAMLASFDMRILPIDQRHALTAVDPEPPTRDPFDRMLLAQCQVEDLRLVTVDRALVDHPLAWREA